MYYKRLSNHIVSNIILNKNIIKRYGILSDGLVMYLPFNEGVGDTANDLEWQ